MPDEIFEQYAVCSWKVKGEDALVIPVERIEESGGNRIVSRERPYRDGAKLDDTGAKPKQWVLSCSFFNGHTEPGMPNPDATGASETLYPDHLNKVIASCDKHETGDLILPTVGKRRCRAESYRRVEEYTERDAASVTLTFTEDNEDGVTASSFTAPSVRAVSRSLAEATVFDLEEAGLGGDLAGDLEEFASDLEGLAAAPGEFVGDLEAKAKSIEDSCERIEAVHTQAVNTVTGEVATLLTSPQNSAGLRHLRKLRDTVARAVGERVASAPKIVPKVFTVPKSIFGVATELQQDADKLMQINPQIEDHLLIPANTVIKVFDSP